MIDDDRVVHEVVIPAAIEAVFDAFVDPDLLVCWIGISAQLEPVPGGAFRFEIEPGQFCEGTYVSLERPTRVSFTWGWIEPTMGVPPGSSLVEVTLTPLDADTTRLRLIHTVLAEDRRELHDLGWTHFLGRLASSVASTSSATPENADGC